MNCNTLGALVADIFNLFIRITQKLQDGVSMKLGGRMFSVTEPLVFLLVARQLLCLTPFWILSLSHRLVKSLLSPVWLWTLVRPRPVSPSLCALRQKTPPPPHPLPHPPVPTSPPLLSLFAGPGFLLLFFPSLSEQRPECVGWSGWVAAGWGWRAADWKQGRRTDWDKSFGWKCVKHQSCFYFSALRRYRHC